MHIFIPAGSLLQYLLIKEICICGKQGKERPIVRGKFIVTLCFDSLIALFGGLAKGSEVTAYYAACCIIQKTGGPH